MPFEAFENAFWRKTQYIYFSKDMSKRDESIKNLIFLHKSWLNYFVIQVNPYNMPSLFHLKWMCALREIPIVFRTLFQIMFMAFVAFGARTSEV